MTPSQFDKGQTFRALHEGEAFVIPNPWDAGSARALAKLGFRALASTSGGFAQTLGRSDGEVSLDEVVEHARALDGATDLAVSMDLENGYGPEAADAALAITRVAGAGAVGGSIEDWDPTGNFIYEVESATERVAVAAEAARALDFPFTLTARAENHLRDNPDLDDTIRRLRAYEEAGADVLYAPGLRTDEEIRTVCAAVSKPVNVLAFPGMSMDLIAAAGAQRVSLGSWLSHVASGAAMKAASKIRDTGDFSALSP
ncbi:MAG: isocitrate lyase/phosphoenolpyruvate mutase family protein [Thermoleophilaceae bacterium]|nr:isocitrate lyase/phosphoenolpyruvate mutase family protein [Thermoleophilaceae bacterium]